MRNRQLGTLNQKAGPQSDKITELQAAAGEVALAKFLNVYPDMADEPGEYDLYWNDYKVDVKTTKHKHGHLEVSINKKPGKVDIYALVIGEFPRFRIAGWMMASEIMQDHRLYTYERSGSKVWRARQDELVQDWEVQYV
jgi:hypothetical protein